MPKSLQGSKYAFGVHFFKEVFKIGTFRDIQFVRVIYDFYYVVIPFSLCEISKLMDIK